MCPTLLGRSQTAVCPYCGDVAYTPWNTDFSPVDAEGRVCTCTQCGLVHRSRELSDEILAPDGFMVNKLLTPRRWDLVQFRALHITPGPDAPVIRYVKRVVGLPGEEVVIKDGGVWIDGQRLPLPEDIARLEFQDKFEGHLPIFWGSEKTPAKLAADEYFVVGDFGYRSNDSRMWQHKLDGHPPYALPASYIEGVVDLRYSPLSRWHVFR
jgi:signal peptidase I